MATYKGTANLDPATGAFSFVPDPPVSPPPPPVSAWKLGQLPFSASSPWNTPISANAKFTKLNWPAPNAGGYNYGQAWSSYSPAVYQSASSDQIVRVNHPVTWGRPAGTESIHMPDAAVGAPGSDGELVVIDGTTVHSFWRFVRTPGAATASCSAWAKCDVTADNGFGWPGPPSVGAGTTAIGSSMFGGLIVQAETDAGPIGHALGLRVDNSFALSGFVPPAIAGDGGSSTGQVKEGQLLAIPPGTAVPSGLSPLGLQVFNAFQKYGAFVNDVAGGVYGPRMQANAYDDPTNIALWHDMSKLVPLLQKVN